MSLFNRQGIPKALLRDQGGTGNRYESLGADSGNNKESNGDNSALDTSINDGFKDDILALRNYLFISLTTDATTFKMHGLVQLAT